MRVYIAGPYTHGDVAVIVRTAMLAGMELMKAGHTVFIPHLTHYLHLLDPQPWEFWIRYDTGWVLSCDSVVRLPGDSLGADREVAIARENKIPVYFGVQAFLLMY